MSDAPAPIQGVVPSVTYDGKRTAYIAYTSPPVVLHRDPRYSLTSPAVENEYPEQGPIFKRWS